MAVPGSRLGNLSVTYQLGNLSLSERVIVRVASPRARFRVPRLGNLSVTYQLGNLSHCERAIVGVASPRV